MLRALALFSGSLASRVAARMVGLSPDVSEVYLLHFRSPFFEEHESIRELVRTEWRGSCFRTQSLKKDYRRLANIPPGETFCLKRSCVSCRTIMLSRAYRYMERIKADFVVTGEMVGRNGLGETEMEGILENLGIAGYVLRPLSARRLAATHPEREGWIPRMSLGNLRADEPEKLITLAATLGLPTDDPMGLNRRCKLTYDGFGRRLERLLEEDGFTLNALKLLDFSVFYKMPPDIKIVLATNEDEKRSLQCFFLPQDLRVYLPAHRGPMTLVRTVWRTKTKEEIDEIIELAGRITATHSDGMHENSVPVSYRFEKDDETSKLHVAPFPSIEAVVEHCTSPRFSSSLA